MSTDTMGIFLQLYQLEMTRLRTASVSVAYSHHTDRRIWRMVETPIILHQGGERLRGGGLERLSGASLAWALQPIEVNAIDLITRHGHPRRAISP